MSTSSVSTQKKVNADGTLGDSHRFIVLDSLRGVCALLVAVHHFKASGAIADNVFIANAYLFVDFFFVLSGYVIALTYRNKLHNREHVRSYLGKRFARLYPLYIVSLLPFVLIEAVVIPYFPSVREPFVPPVDIESLVLTVLFLNSVGLTPGLTWNYPSWSISAEMITYAWFGLAVLLTGSRLALTLAIVGTAALFWIIVASHRFMDVTHELGAVRCAAGFAVGAVLWEGRRWVGALRVPPRAQGTRPSGRSWLAATGLEVAAVLAVIGFVVFAGRSEASYAAPLLFAVVIAVFAREQGGLSLLLSHRAFIALGAWSYSIYLVHAFWASRIFSGGLQILDSRGMDVLHKSNGRFGATDLDGNMMTVVYLSAVIATAAVSFRLIEIPGQKIVRRLLRVH